MQKITSLIIKCPLCGKIHESAQIMRPVNNEIAALWMSCPERREIFLPKETLRALAEYYARKERYTGKHSS
ncbi:MAG: hypothetical protein ACI4CS_01215 [Candidatus Weimeria sp.]